MKWEVMVKVEVEAENAVSAGTLIENSILQWINWGGWGMNLPLFRVQAVWEKP